MKLALPAFSLAVEGNLPVQFHPRHIDPEQPLPLRVAFSRRYLRFFINDMLEVIDHCTVGNKRDCVRKMAVDKLLRVSAEESFCVLPSEELHAHGVYFARFHARVCVLSGNTPAVHPVGKGMARFVGYNLNIMLGAVEIRKNERTLVQRKADTVTARLLPFRGKHIQELFIQHCPEKTTRFR